MTALRQAAENYLALRRSLGFALVDPGRLMLDFAGHLDDAGVTHITIERALAWATSPGATPYWHWYRLCAVRGLAAYLHAFDPGHQIPPADLLPRRYHRAAPFLFTDTDIATLIEAAGAAPASLHALTYQTLIGLLAVTGIRPGEAYALDREHVDLDAAMLTIVNGKYGKSRELPLHPSTVRVLDYYLHRRDVLIRRPIIAPSFFVSLRGNRLKACNADIAFARVARRAGLRPHSARARPCLKGLRHSFAVNTLTDWYRAGADVDAHLPLLSTWLGHVDPASTYWYLQATPQLLALAAERLYHSKESTS